MRRAAAIITDHSRQTLYAAIISCELGMPAIVGTGNATYLLHSGQDVTVDCSEGNVAFVYDGTLDITMEMVDLSGMSDVRTDVMLNLADPLSAYCWWCLPADGIGLACMEFVVTNSICVHLMALVRYNTLRDRHYASR